MQRKISHLSEWNSEQGYMFSFYTKKKLNNEENIQQNRPCPQSPY